MKFVFGGLLLLASLAMPQASQAQASVYGEFSVADLHNLVSRDFLYGVTTGLLYDGPTVAHHMVLSADIQGRFVFGDGEKFDGINVGPRITFPLHRLGHIAPYGEFLVGFARFDGNAATQFYNGPNGNDSTDGTIQLNAGVEKKISPRLDGVAEYSYSQFYAFGGQYNPKTFSLGVRYHFVAR